MCVPKQIFNIYSYTDWFSSLIDGLVKRKEHCLKIESRKYLINAKKVTREWVPHFDLTNSKR